MPCALDGCELTWEGAMLQDQSKKVPPHLFGWQLCLMAGQQDTITMIRSRAVGKKVLSLCIKAQK
jgi:hypothetical protein